MPAALFATGEPRCYSLKQSQASSSPAIALQRRERGGLEDPGFLVLVRAHLGAAPQVVLEHGIVHQGVSLSLAVGLAFVAPHVYHLVERPHLGDRVEHGFAAVLRSEEHTSELQSRQYLVCRLLL